MAYELHICIATLGAVWSSDVKQKADAQVCKAKKILKDKSQIPIYLDELGGYEYLMDWFKWMKT